jgi:hypothetical protein
MARISGLKNLNSFNGYLLHWAAATLKGHVGFQNKKFYATFHHHFKPKIIVSRVKILFHLF